MGEFSYKIDLNASLPPPTETIVLQCRIPMKDNELRKNLRIVWANAVREKAVSVATTMMIAQHHLKGNNLVHSDSSKSTMSINLSSVAKLHDEMLDESSKISRILKKSTFQLPKKSLRYRVTYSSNFFSGPSEITVHPVLTDQSHKNDIKRMTTLEKSWTDLPMIFSPKVKYHITDI